MALIWLPEAKADIQRLFDFLADVNPTAAAKAIRLIRTGAEAGGSWPPLAPTLKPALAPTVQRWSKSRRSRVASLMPADHQRSNGLRACFTVTLGTVWV